MSIFSKVARSKPKTSIFNLSEEHRLSCNMGYLIPILCKEVLPSDRFRINTELLIKLAPLKAPMMQRLKAKVDYFYVPTYQVCDSFKDFINPKVNVDNSIVLPYFTPVELTDYGDAFFGLESLADYLGLPVDSDGAFDSTNEEISLLPFLVYQHIYNAYYRDQNLQPDEGDLSTISCCNIDYFKDLQGNVADRSENPEFWNQVRQLFKLRSCAWKKDYFTSALPSPQAGDDVMIPVGDRAPIRGNAPVKFEATGSNLIPPFTTLSQAETDNDEASDSVGLIANFVADDEEMGQGTFHASLDGNFADLSQASGISINNFRKLFQLQKFKELAERGGTRYNEIVRNFFNAFIPDGYIDRPIYLGGQVQPINVGEVIQTSGTDSNSPQGYRAGIANSYGRTRNVVLHANAHGYVMGLLRIMPEATYSQGLERMWTRKNIFDYAWPQFANIGEQEILNKELFYYGNSADNDVFGYTPRYAEYKTGHCHTCGQFRPGGNLAYWSMQRKFSNRPLLNADFIEMAKGINYDPFYQTTAAVEHCYVDLYNHITARRPLPYFGTPAGV